MPKFFSFPSYVHHRLLSESRVYPYGCFLCYNVLREEYGKKPILLKTAYHFFRVLNTLQLIQKEPTKTSGPGAPRQYYVKGENFNSRDWNSPQRAFDLLTGFVVVDPSGKRLSKRSLGRKYQSFVHPSSRL